MICFPNAKINIGLYITEKRNDNYHNIESVFYPIPWKDALEAVPSNSFSFESTGLAITSNSEQNLIVKAFRLLEPYFKTTVSASIHLHKVIPMGAGLGGGSADGAFALKLFNTLFELGLQPEELERLAAKLGSDCPFFIYNKPMFCYDRGIKFKPVELSLQGKKLVLVNPRIHISTAEAYAAIYPKPPKVSLPEVILQPLENWKGMIQNDFETALSAKYPQLAAIKQQLYDAGAAYASMSGSGSTVMVFLRNRPIWKAFLQKIWFGIANCKLNTLLPKPRAFRFYDTIP